MRRPRLDVEDDKNCWVFNFDYHLDHSRGRHGDRREICRALKPRRYKLDEYGK